MSGDRKTFFLMDGHAHFFRAYHAIRSGMSSPVTNEPTNMTFGFVGAVLKILRTYSPDYFAVVIDVSGDRESFRSEIYPEYKANREPPPEDFRPQVQRCLGVLEQLHVPVLGESGVEADDVIATIVRRVRADHPEIDIRIASRDKDLVQLLDDHVQMLDVYKDETVSPADIFKTPGVEPQHVIDILALMGDNVDNVPGVPGIGPKTAAKLILQYGSIIGLLKHIEEIKGKRRENLEAHRDQIGLSKQLVTLRDDVDVDFALEAAAVDIESIPVETLLSTFRELDFNRHADDLKALTGRADAQPAAPTAASPSEQGMLFGDIAAETADPVPPVGGTYEVITDTNGLRDLVDRVRAAGSMALDTETDGLLVMQTQLCGISVAIEPGAAWYIPVRSPEMADHLDADTALQLLKSVLEDTSIEKTGHNLKFDVNVLRRHGVRVAGRCFDTMIASYVVDATRSSHRLDALALGLLNRACIPITDLIGKRGRSQLPFDRVPLDRAVPYAAEDADVALQLRSVLEPRIESMGLRPLAEDVEFPLLHVLAELEYNGIRVDPEELRRQEAGLGKRLETLRREIQDNAPHPFNPDSPKQLAAALFNRPDQEPPGLGLPSQKRLKTGPSTDQEVLEKLATDASIDATLPELILEYRQLTKLTSTYLIALREVIDPGTGRVHASFNQTVAATGRLSSSDPNLQNIPIRTDIGREIRRAFIAAPGNVLLTADYSQIELRLLAHLSGDPALIEAFEAGADIHTAVAAEVHGVAVEEVTREQRDSAKMVNFGIIYGITPYGLARRLGPDVGVDDAARIITDYKARFARIETFLQQCVQTAKDQGYVETILGRRRNIPEVSSRARNVRALGERMAINTVVQGSAADLIKLAMINLHRRLPETFSDTRMILQIHDELVFESPRETIDELTPFVKAEMSGALDLKVELVVETAWSENWIDAK